ncbi:MAG: alanine:cation symporter family protein, partial [Bacteroidia bacterium]|nr:alanine:cation symporter family protein [Bacteroidia bacterium]
MKKILLLSIALLSALTGFAQEKGIDEKVNDWFMPIATWWEGLVFTSIPLGDLNVPIVVILLVVGASFFTIYFGFPNLTKFGLAINTVRGKYDSLDHHSATEEPSDQAGLSVDGDIIGTIKDESKIGEVSHFQALATAVSGTVGLGNIAGVAVAIAMGGPGATFWMIVCGFIGMASKFTECTLGVTYRDIGEDGTVYGGPMYYLKKGLAAIGMKGFGNV